MKRIAALAVCSLLLSVPGAVRAGEIGHFNGGFNNIRDYFVPAEHGVYAALYNYYYTTNRVNDNHGDKIDNATVVVSPGPGPGVSVPIDVDVDVDLYAVAPVVIWAPETRVLGARYAALVAPIFANASVQASLNVGRFGGDASGSSFNIGDTFVQPIWLTWGSKHFDVTAAYGFYAATGKYDTNTITTVRNFTLATPAVVEDPNNIGYGFWTHQFQTGVAWYPFENKGTAVTGIATYEHHSDKEDFDLQPGDDITLNWGISQYLPLTSDHHLLLEIGPAGWNGFQVSDDRGADASGDNRDRTYAVGGQLGITYVPWLLAVNFHGFYEYYTRDRFQGSAFGLSIAKGF